MNFLIKKPLITEKNTFYQEQGVYAFEVDSKASKPEIKKAIEKGFRVKVDEVRTLNCRGKAKSNRFGSGRVPRWKKALVKLSPGQKIEIFEGA
jgi:large subunit ribosomal protein L23